MNAHKLRIEGTGLDPKIYLDDQEISTALRGVSLDLRVRALPKTVLDVLVVEVTTELDGVAAIIPDESRDLLVKLGWTPPEGT